MNNLPTVRKTHTSMWPLWTAIAVAIVIAVAGTASLPRNASANTLDPPRLTVLCSDGGITLLWTTGDDGQIEAPEGWKVERTHRDAQGNSFVQAFNFVGAKADALLTPDMGNWLWEDTSIDRNLPYTYRVRGIDADGANVDDRTWSGSVLVDCFGEHPNQPGLSLPVSVSDGFALLWRTMLNGLAEAPDGWKFERKHVDREGNAVVQYFTFIGPDADALLTTGGRYWKWVDRSADLDSDYTYRVRAINADGTDRGDRIWSRSVSTSRLTDTLNRPGISVPQCHDNGVSMFWHAGNRGQLAAPEGWKVERRHRDSDRWGVRTFTFIGEQADALQTFNEQYWDWVDTTAAPNVDYTYRVRAINSDGSDMSDRVWSRRAPVECAPAVGLLNQPGISGLQCHDDGVSLFWHTGNRGQLAAPEGWKVERRHRDSGRRVVQAFTFVGDQADALRTFNEEYWDWLDTTAAPNVDYTYRVKAINADGSDMSGRVWSRRAPVECVSAVA